MRQIGREDGKYMIFVTVGTHEQPFNRLVEYIDNLKRDAVITEEVIMQTGFCTYEPQYCQWEKLLPYKKMQQYVREAHIVITHGGPSSFIMPLQIGKTPIVVPRQYQFGEHVNNHQVEFVKIVSERMGTIIPVFDVEELSSIIKDYDARIVNMQIQNISHNVEFNSQFATLVDELFGGGVLESNISYVFMATAA